MRKLLFASAAVLLSGSFAYADNPLIPNDNDNMAARGFIIEQSQAVWTGRAGTEVVTSTYRGGAVTTATSAAPRVSPGFLLHSSNDGHKKVENQYSR
jgi:hypothetical protein